MTESPRDVRIVLPDGSEHPCEVYPDGIDDDGNAMWKATVPLAVGQVPGARVKVGLLPAHTGIRFEVVEDDG